MSSAVKVLEEQSHTWPYKAARITQAGPWKPKGSLRNSAEPKIKSTFIELQRKRNMKGKE